MGFLRTILVLQGKHVLVMFRSPVVTVFEFLVMFCMLGLTMLVGTILNAPASPLPLDFEPIPEEKILEHTPNMRLVYLPDTEFTKKLMELAVTKLKVLDTPNLQGVGSEKDMLASIDDDLKEFDLVIAVIFVQVDEQQHRLDYRLRAQHLDWQTSGDLRRPLHYPPWEAASEVYKESGFLAVQHAVESSFVTLSTAPDRVDSYTPAPAAVQRFPFPAYAEHNEMNEGVAMVFVHGPIVTVGIVVTGIIRDKVAGATELMKLMGVSRGVIWLSWFLRGFLITEIYYTITVWYAFSFMKLIPLSNPWLLWLTVTLFAAATATFLCAITTLFHKGSIAMICVILIWFFFPSLMKELSKHTKSLAVQIPSLLVPTQAIYAAIVRITLLEKNGVGLQWSTVGWSSSDDALTFAHVLTMMTSQIVLFTLAMWYLDAVFPGPYGVAAPWNFCLTVCRRQRRRDPDLDDTESAPSASTQMNYEQVPEGVEVAIHVVDLHKTFPSGKVAVNGVTLDVYDDQITALLGHNGAGKTTTFLMITGMLSSTSGNIWVYGYNTRTDLRRVRASMGLCPQQNMLFAKLTVMDHLVFYAMLKGYTYSEAQSEADDLLKKLELTKKQGVKSAKLSGGMKRKLSLAIALIGGSRVIVLDEPTSGLDPEARRKVWDILQAMRSQRTILLTTHFMEEADALGDRIAIMHQGRVQCYGTSLYLKKLYASGYVLKLLTTPQADAEGVARFVRTQLPSARLKSQTGAEMSFTLPQEQKGSFAGLFEAIETNKTKLGVISIGVSMATLEDVFIAAGKEARGAQESDADEEAFQRRLSDTGPVRRTRGLLLKIQQVYGVVVKKFTDMRRNCLQLIIAVLITLLFTFITISAGDLTFKEQRTQQPPLALTLSSHAPTTVIFNAPDEVAVHLQALATAAGVETQSVGNVRAAILNIGKKDMGAYARLVIAVDMSSPTQAVGWYSGESHHGMALSLNLINNVQLRAATGAADALITVTNYPLALPASYDLNTERGMHIAALVISGLWALFVPFGIVLIYGALLEFTVVERASGGKRLQLMSGITTILYWLTNALVDFLFYAIAVVLIVVLFFSLDTGHYGSNADGELGVFALILLVYGLPGLPYAYLYHYLSDSKSTCYTIYAVVNTMIPLAIQILLIFQIKLIISLNDALVVLMPPYTLSQALSTFVVAAIQNHRCDMIDGKKKTAFCEQHPMDTCCNKDGPPPLHLDFFGPDVLRKPLLAMCFEAVIYLSLLVLIECSVLAWTCELLKAGQALPCDDPATLDDDVRTEAERVANNKDEDALAVERLAKLHGLSCKRPLTVRGVSFGVPRGECFGLLGVNGAGKTTTFRMLTGDLVRTRGYVRVRDPLRATKKKHEPNVRLIGYCPQFDAFCESLTGREMLYLYARLRGVHRKQLRAEVDRWILIIGLSEYQHKQSGTYSGGNKRKLSTAMALIGDPPLVLLDEPTCGVDPVARRNIWRVLAAVQSADTAIVLTSHSMDECEALCSRLAIMVDGQFRCMGNSQHLKHKFGRGFTVMVTMRRTQTNPEAVIAFQAAMHQTFPSAVIKGNYQGVLNYHVTDVRVRWGSLFSGMEALKSRHANVEDYQVSETSLEQVFLSFARREERLMLD